jgi:pimeloyl-ACP methyl ester carboxylesterase
VIYSILYTEAKNADGFVVQTGRGESKIEAVDADDAEALEVVRRGATVASTEDVVDAADAYVAMYVAAVEVLPANGLEIAWGGTVVLELYRHHPELVATLILIDTYAGWKGSLPEEEVRARVEGVRQMLAVPAEEFDPTLPGWFVGDPPSEFVPLIEEMSADVRPKVSSSAARDGRGRPRDLLPRITVPTLRRCPARLLREREPDPCALGSDAVKLADSLVELRRARRLASSISASTRASSSRGRD